MSLPLAYLGVIVIWSTTPLAIQWSTAGTGFAFAVLARMVIGLALAGALMLAWRIEFPRHARARRAYLVSGLGLFGAMALTYWSACRLPSGLISVFFGLSPLMAGTLSALVLGERGMTPAKLGGLLLGAAGLALIFLDGDSLNGVSSAGLVGLLLAVAIYSGSLVWLKHIADDSPPLATTAGSLAVSLPFFALLWWLGDGGWPAAPPERALAAIAYLGVFGSVLGFALYYYMIKHLPAANVALSTLVTPVAALVLGHLFNGESVAPRVALGSAVILLGLACHQADGLRAALRRQLR